MATETNRPLIQIDDLVREMTDEEFTEYQNSVSNASSSSSSSSLSSGAQDGD